jgi:hypothetical protein
MSFFQTYAATQGLDRFPPNQRFRIWREAHKKLKVSNPSYRVACRTFIATTLAVTTAFCLIWIVPVLLRRTGVIGGESERVFFEVFGLVAIPVFLAWTLISSFRHQTWLNVMVATELQKQLVNVLPPAHDSGDRERIT